MHASVIPKLSVIVSTSLAQAVEVETCNENPCRGLEALVDETLLLWPVGIALAGWTVAALPTFCLGSRRKAEGMRSCLGVLALLWASMVWSYWLFTSSSRVLGYVWSLHGCASILDAWRPAKGVLAHDWLQRVGATLGVWGIAGYAFQFGPSAGLPGWHGWGEARCGWSVHLAACLGVDLMLWAVGAADWAVGRVWGF